MMFVRPDTRPWHDAWVITHTCAHLHYANQEKGGLGWQ